MSIDRTPSFVGMIFLAVLVVGGGTVSRAQTPGPAHPLDQLTAAELQAATEALTAAGHVDDDARFHLINLHEPVKADVVNWEPGAPFQRARAG